MASQEEGVVEPSTTQCFAEDAMRILKQQLDLISEMLQENDVDQMLEENDVAANDWTSVDFADPGSRSIVVKPMQVKLKGPMMSQIRTVPRRIDHSLLCAQKRCILKVSKIAPVIEI
ncbi:hypothetical protein ABFS82_10G096900 [Erythranthe guttata]|uniref:uncharacterized protein LOC105961212 n=1 Tax=Erythranthe guttata TaxID=4155 RepID=UPI00064E0334|nr:PREDICTED: uncharacterized protein LOC105961212 [Erythranthe guttata]|eukprot:XP_012840906.1 PREDICTED: uncharacterized protein LOC105961212 [Erythranthe guttata]